MNKQDIFENNPEFKKFVHKHDSEGYKFDYDFFWGRIFPKFLAGRLQRFGDLMDYTYLYRFKKRIR